MSHSPHVEAHIRPAQPDDLPACVEVFQKSLSDMQTRHNFPSSPVAPASEVLALYQHILETGIFHLSEVEGQIAGIACAILREPLWFLSGFWVQPGMQGQGLGMPLLGSVWQAGQQAGMSKFFVWSSIDLPAMAAYLKLGMLPGYQILTFEGQLSLQPGLASGYTREPLQLDFANRVDESILGARRQIDHEFWERKAIPGFQVRHLGEPIGYFYLNGEVIGPAAWLHSAHALPLLTLACLTAEHGPVVRLRIPGVNHDALRFALESGLQLIGFSHLLLTAPFGQLEQYLPSGPGLF